jgi:hypothetical protein
MAPAGFLQDCLKKIKLQSGFSPREGNTSFGVLVENGVFGHFFYDLSHRHPLSHSAEGLGGADLDAGHTFLAKGSMPNKSFGR